MTKYFYVLVQRGEIEKKLIPKEELDIGKMLIKLQPGKMEPEKCIIMTFDSQENNPEFWEEFWREFERLYLAWGRFGSFGDAILIERSHADVISYNILAFGWLEYQTMRQATDMMPFFRDSTGKIYYIGIFKEDRKTKEIYKATVGGCQDVAGYDCEAPIRTGIREIAEETTLQIYPVGSSAAKRSNDPDVQRMLAMVRFADDDLSLPPFWLKRIGAYWTSKAEENKNTETKRVHMTTVFGFICDVPFKIRPREFRKLFTAMDDAKYMLVWNTDNGIPGFRAEHHKMIYKKTVKKLKI